MHKVISALVVICATASACSKPQQSLPSETQTHKETAAQPAAGGSGPATVTGVLPKAVGGFPSILILEPQGPANVAPPADTPYMDQIQQTFIPPVLMVRTGQPVEFRNNDEVLHNVRVREDATHTPAFNVAIPTGEKYTFTFPRDGFYDVGCDIHPGMSAQIVATASPYTAVADAQGNFAIANVPSGGYKAIVYAGSEKIERDFAVSGSKATFNLGQ
jgi:plastocyanin